MEKYGQTVSKAYHVKDGVGNDGKGKTWTWRMWNIYLEGNDKKFLYFTSGKKPEPFAGMKIGYMKYSEKQEVSKKDGKTYTNYTIDELKVSEEPVGLSEPPDTIIQNKPQGRDFHAESFGKCKFGFLQQAFVPWIKNELEGTGIEALESMAEEFAEMSMRILQKPDISEPASTAFNTDEIPLDAYDEV